MKKFYYLLFLPLFIILYSCNSNDKRIVIGVSQCSDDAWRKYLNEEIQREASFYDNVDVVIKTAFDSNQKQIRDIEELIDLGVDLLVVAPNEAIPLTSVIEKAISVNIPVILVDRKINSGKYTAFVGADNFQIGREVGVYTVNLLKGKGNIVEIKGLEGSTPAVERHEGFMSIINKYPDIKIIYQADGEWLKSKAKEKMTDALNIYGNVDLIFAHNDEMAIGAQEAVKVRSDIKKPIILGIDALPGSQGGIQNVINGNIDATFIYPTGGDKVVQLAMNILKKDVYEKENTLFTAVVDKTNARVIKLQTDQIIQHQSRIGILNNVVNKSLELYSTQRAFLIASLFVIVFAAISILLLLRAYKHKNKYNKLLESKNQAINSQKEELLEQKDQLVALSKNLEEATHAKLVFFTNISHEFRTPLTLLLGPLENILKNETLSKDGSKLAQMMKKNVQVLMKLVDQIIEFRRYENGKMQMYFTLNDLSQYIRDVYNSFEEISKKKHLHLQFKSSNDDFMVWFDNDKMEKILNNLLSNAIKFTPENGHIKINLSRVEIENEAFAKISIKDTGIGIAEEHLDKIFDRYYKIDNTATGSGIGLALTKVLVELHNGQIQVDSHVGNGTCFDITIPYKQKNIAVNEQYPVLDGKSFVHEDIIIPEFETEEQDIHNINYEKPTILIVEDNADVRQFIKILFKDDFQVIEASNGQNGLYKAMKFVPEIIISDVMMDTMDGYTLCRKVKENITTSHIPVILLTAHALDEQKIIGFESGADAFIAKPFNEEILKIRVRKLVENREKVKEFFQKHLTFGDPKDKISEIDKTFIDKFRKIVEDNLIDSDLNVDEIGKNLGFSRVHLYRKIKSLTNYAPNELVRIIRLKAAEQILLKSEKTISEVAYDTGFSSPSYFTKCFKEYFNESPTEFIKRIKAENS